MIKVSRGSSAATITVSWSDLVSLTFSPPGHRLQTAPWVLFTAKCLHLCRSHPIFRLPLSPRPPPAPPQPAHGQRCSAPPPRPAALPAPAASSWKGLQASVYTFRRKAINRGGKMDLCTRLAGGQWPSWTPHLHSAARLLPAACSTRLWGRVSREALFPFLYLWSDADIRERSFPHCSRPDHQAAILARRSMHRRVGGENPSLNGALRFASTTAN